MQGCLALGSFTECSLIGTKLKKILIEPKNWALVYYKYPTPQPCLNVCYLQSFVHCERLTLSQKQIQQLATRLVKGFCRLSYEERLRRLGLHS